MAIFDNELRGIGGWLAFFLVTLGIVTPLTSLFSVGALAADPAAAAGYGENWNTLLAFEWAMAGLTAAAAWIAVWHFFKVKQRRTVRIAVLVLWAMAFIALVAEPIGVAMLAGITYGELFEQTPDGFIRPVVYSTIWTAYLLKSVRVANTYPAEGSAGEVVETFS